MGKENTYKPQKLWFIDKNTGEKAVVSAEKIENGKITFSYQGKQYTIPVSMLGKKVYACLPEKPQAKGSVEKEIFYQGEYFKWVNDQWVSSSGYIPKEKYQNRLSSPYQKRREHYGHPVKDLIAFARKQGKDEVGIHTAIRSLEIAMLRASAGEAKSFLATLCSLYRQTNSPNAVISVYDYVAKKYGQQVETAPFLTSVSAAFMDIGDIEMANRVKNKAFTLSGGNDIKLEAFSQRFQAETRLD